jgi:hypothetical protein
MRQDAIFQPLRIVSYLVVLMMLASVIYAAYITLTHWSGIGV